jgi:hypothetical protein
LVWQGYRNHDDTGFAHTAMLAVIHIAMILRALGASEFPSFACLPIRANELIVFLLSVHQDYHHQIQKCPHLAPIQLLIQFPQQASQKSPTPNAHYFRFLLFFLFRLTLIHG